MYVEYSVFFFFQAEDGIRDLTVTGVQTCALPIWPAGGGAAARTPPPPRARRMGRSRPRTDRRAAGTSGTRRTGSRARLSGRSLRKECGTWRAHGPHAGRDRKSTRLNSSHSQISYAVFCLKKKDGPTARVRPARRADVGRAGLRGAAHPDSPRDLGRQQGRRHARRRRLEGGRRGARLAVAVAPTKGDARADRTAILNAASACGRRATSAAREGNRAGPPGARSGETLETRFRGAHGPSLFFF